MGKQFHLDETQLERLYPFYLSINKELKISAFSKQLNKVAALNTDVKLSDIFEVKPAGLLNEPFEQLAGRTFQFIKAKNDGNESAFVIQGELLYLKEEDELLALGLPNVYFFNNKAADNPTQDAMASFIENTAGPQHIADEQQDIEAPVGTLVNQISGVAITTSDGAIEWVSKDFELTMGCTLDEIKGKRPRDVIYGKDSTYIPSSFVDEMVRKKATFSFENVGYNKFGKSFWFKTTVQPIVDSKSEVTGRYYMFEDVTNLKIKDDLFKHSYDLWRFAITGSGDGVWAYDVQTGKITTSERVKELLGIEGAEDISIYNAVALVHPEDVMAFEAMVSGILNNNNPSFSYDLRISHKSLNYRYYRIRGKRMTLSTGQRSVFFGTLTDIHTEKEKDLALKNTASRLEALLKNVNFGVLLETEDRKVSLINDELRRIFTIPYTDSEMHGMDCKGIALQMDGLFTGDIPFSARVEDILATKAAVIDELLYTRDGRVLERDYIPIFVNNIYNGHLWRYKDVTSRVMLEKNLEISEMRLTVLMNHMKQAVVFEDIDRNIIYMNDVLIELIRSVPDINRGISGKTTNILRTLRSLFADPDEELVKIERIVANKVEVDNDIVNLSNGRILSRQFIPIVIDKEESGYLWVYEDITDSIKAQQELINQKEYYHRILNEIPADIVILTKENAFSFANKSAIKDDEMREWVIGRNMYDYCRKRNIDERFAIEREALFREVWQSQKVHTVVDHYHEGKENEKYILRMLYPFLSDGQELEFLVVYGIDITEQKKNEQNAEKNLNEIIDRERALNTNKTQFIRITSHELRTPLAIIQANAELLQMVLLPLALEAKTEKVNQMLSRIVKEVNHMTELLNQLMFVNRMETGKMEFTPTSCNVKQLLVDIALDMFQPNGDGRNLLLALPVEEVIVTADSRLLRHAIVNLVNNAFKYSPNAAESPVLRLFANTNAIVIEVEDFGVGIPEEDQPKLFTSFFRAGNTGNISGSGLGLTIVEYVIGLHKGKIEFNSVLNKGTTFRIILKNNSIEKDTDS